jgi:hypothetical protein
MIQVAMGGSRDASNPRSIRVRGSLDGVKLDLCFHERVLDDGAFTRSGQTRYVHAFELFTVNTGVKIEARVLPIDFWTSALRRFGFDRRTRTSPLHRSYVVTSRIADRMSIPLALPHDVEETIGTHMKTQDAWELAFQAKTGINAFYNGRTSLELARLVACTRSQIHLAAVVARYDPRARSA